MKALKKTVLGIAMALAFAGGAQATPINVGGVIWDPDNAIDFSSASLAIHQSIDGTTGELSGFGTINSINGSTSFCSGCELTFQFGGYMPSIAGTVPTIGGAQVPYTGGWVQVFVDFSPEAVNSNVATMTLASTGDGSLWLNLLGHINSITGYSFAGQYDLNSGALTGSGALDVIAGGIATANFDTNTRPDGADISFSNSFTTFLPASPINLLNALGTGNFYGNTIPEPGSLALAGLGLLGLGALRRRREAK